MNWSLRYRLRKLDTVLHSENVYYGNRFTLQLHIRHAKKIVKYGYCVHTQIF